MTQTHEEFIVENFKRWVSLNTKKAFDLKGSKEDVKHEFLKKYFNQEFSSLDDLIMTVVNSYLKSDIRKIMPYINEEEMGMGIKNKAVFLNEFLGDYIVDKKIACKTNNEFYGEIANFLASTLEDACGDVVWTDKLIPTGKELFRRKLVESLKDKGYLPYKKDSKIWMRPNSDKQDAAEQKHQRFLIEQYCKLVKEYVQKHDMHTLKKSDEKEFYEFWSVVECVFVGYEAKISEAAKRDSAFLEAKALADKFFAAENLEKNRKAHTRHGKRGNYCEAIYEAIHNFKDGVQTEEDVQMLKDFYGRVEKLNKALSVTDEKEKGYPTNYFVCMPDIHPASMLDLLSSIERNKIFEGEKAFVIGDTKRLIRKSFATNTIRNNGDTCDLSVALHSHRIRVERGDFVIDNTTEEGYKTFVGRVAKIIEENKLPSSDICAAVIARDLMAGRENPINMPKESGKESIIEK